MIELQLNEQTYLLPESWSEVTLEQYVNVLNAKLDNVVSRIKARVKCIAILGGEGKLEESLMMLDSQDINELLTEFNWINIDPDFNALPAKDTLTVNDKTFKIKKDFNKLTTNEMILIEELTQSKSLDLHHFEIAFGVLFRELDEQGNEKDLTLEGLFEQIKEFRGQVYLKDVFAVLAFFLPSETKPSSKTSAFSSTNQTMKLKMKKMKKV